ncbi:MAG: ChaN family lipoprotein [Bacteroidia bacterium]
MKARLLFGFVAIAAAISIAAGLNAYKIYSKQLKSVDFDELVAATKEADVVLFGELHNNTIAHWLQLELTKALQKEKGNNLVLGAEMFEADGQLLLDEYLTGEITEKNFEKESKLWPNYSTDYKPLVKFAKENGLHFVATNIPRRYASKVAYEGVEALDDLSKQAKSYMCKLPFDVDSTLPGYNALLHMNMGPHGSSENFMNAQAIKDATMAHFILENLGKEQTFLHYNGAYHSNNFEGISWYLKQKKSKLKIVTISSREVNDVSTYDDSSKPDADFMIYIDEDVTKTY